MIFIFGYGYTAKHLVSKVSDKEIFATSRKLNSLQINQKNIRIIDPSKTPNILEKYKNEILLELNKNAKELEIFLLSVFGKNLGSIIFEMIKKNQIEETLNFRAKMINKIKFYSLKRYPLLTIKSSIDTPT